MPAFVRTLVKVAVASLIVGTVLAHFGITTDRLMQEVGLSPERVVELARQGLTWALPNLLLGALVIVPVWFLVYLFRPPRAAQRLSKARVTPARQGARRVRARPLAAWSAARRRPCPAATTAIMMVQIALISGFTPSRTSE